MLKSEEISSILKYEIENYSSRLMQEDVGTVVKVGDSIAAVYGLPSAKAGELLEFPGNVFGMAMNLESETIGCILFGDDKGIQEGDPVKRTRKVTEIPVGEALLGRVIDPIGRPLDGKGEIKTTQRRPIEISAPGVVDRQPVEEPLETGIKAIDALVPIGRGQRELVIGDRQTGKSALCIDAIINQKNKDVICVYVAIGQKANSIASTISVLKEYGAMDYTVVVSAPADHTPALLYIAPYVGCAIGEYFMYKGKHVLIVYDDLSKHAIAYRELSLLLRRPTGREAYPGDVFYLHSRLLERASKLSEKLGGGSMTALPIIETQLGDISAYIPTNVISITDGQIFLDTDMFYQNIRPAIDVGLSVSRVGGAAQPKIMKKITGPLRLELSQFRELKSFAKFSSDELDNASQAQLRRGERIIEVLKQKQFSPITVSQQVLTFYAVVGGWLDSIELCNVQEFVEQYLMYVRTNYHEMESALESVSVLTDELKKLIDESLKKFTDIFVTGRSCHVKS